MYTTTHSRNTIFGCTITLVLVKAHCYLPINANLHRQKEDDDRLQRCRKVLSLINLCKGTFKHITTLSPTQPKQVFPLQPP